MLWWLWVLRWDGEWIELHLSSALIAGEFWSKIKGAQGVSPTDGFAATASSIAAQIKAIVRRDFF
jgi:hypothetical protein